MGMGIVCLCSRKIAGRPQVFFSPLTGSIPKIQAQSWRYFRRIHYILQASLFMSHMVSLAGFVLRRPDRLVLVGAPADTPETEYIGSSLAERKVESVLPRFCKYQDFWEKPSEPQARGCAGGCLWNTFVIVTKLSTLLDADQRLLPELTTRVARAAGRVAVDRGLDIDRG